MKIRVSKETKHWWKVPGNYRGRLVERKNINRWSGLGIITRLDPETISPGDPRLRFIPFDDANPKVYVDDYDNMADMRGAIKEGISREMRKRMMKNHAEFAQIRGVDSPTDSSETTINANGAGV